MSYFVKACVVSSFTLMTTLVYAQGTRVLPPVTSNNIIQQNSYDPQVQQGRQLGDLYIQNTQMQTEIRFLTGRIEELQYKIQELERAQKNSISDIEFRLEELEGIGDTVSDTSSEENDTQTTFDLEPQSVNDVNQSGTPETTLGEIVPGTTSTSNSQVSTAIQQYENALSLLRAGQYGQAESSFQIFLEQYPNSNRTAAAFYWLGETYYVQGQYQEAAKNFLDGFQKFPDNSKATDNLLKLGMSLARLGQNQEACLTFKQLQTRYPDAPEHIVNRVDIENNRTGCQT